MKLMVRRSEASPNAHRPHTGRTTEDGSYAADAHATRTTTERHGRRAPQYSGEGEIVRTPSSAAAWSRSSRACGCSGYPENWWPSSGNPGPSGLASWSPPVPDAPPPSTPPAAPRSPWHLPRNASRWRSAPWVPASRSRTAPSDSADSERAPAASS
ncbi:hypothetical protein QJS66_07780 [Kocuria rhizophila]|nr:hypothetical protein QJS66_07780 [Kocuria rhizophila]